MCSKINNSELERDEANDFVATKITEAEEDSKAAGEAQYCRRNLQRRQNTWWKKLRTEGLEQLKKQLSKGKGLLKWVSKYPEIEDEDALMDEVFAQYSGKREAQRECERETGDELDSMKHIKREWNIRIIIRASRQISKSQRGIRSFWLTSRTRWYWHNLGALLLPGKTYSI